MVLHQGLHLLLSACVPAGDVHMQGVVAAGLAIGPLPPLFESCNQADSRLRHHMVDYKTQTNRLDLFIKLQKLDHTLHGTQMCNEIIQNTKL